MDSNHCLNLIATVITVTEGAPLTLFQVISRMEEFNFKDQHMDALCFCPHIYRSHSRNHSPL